MNKHLMRFMRKDDPNTFFTLSAHPGSGKSYFIRRKFFPHWMITNPEKEAILICATGINVKSYSEELIRDIQHLAPYYDLPVEKKMNFREFILKNGSRFKSFPLDGPVQGQHADLMVWDDLYRNTAAAMSKKIVDFTKEVVTSSILRGRRPGGKVVFPQQIIHKNDIVSTITSYPKSVHMNYKAIADGKTDMLLGKLRPKGSVLVPDGFDKERVLEERARNPVRFSSMWMGDPVSSMRQIFNREMYEAPEKRSYVSIGESTNYLRLNIGETEKLELSDDKNDDLRIFACCDVAETSEQEAQDENKDADYSVLSVFAYHETTDRLFPIKIHRDRVPAGELMNWFRKAMSRMPYIDTLYIEDKRLVAECKQSNINSEQLKHMVMKKTARVELQLENMLHQGLFFIPDNITKP